MAGLALLAMPLATAQAGLLSDFEDGTTQDWAVDPGAAGVTITPDNSTSSEGDWSLRINTPGFFSFGALRYDLGAINAHLPEWQAGETLLYDVKIGTFTDFAAGRWTYQDNFGQQNSGPPDTEFHNLANNEWATFAWDFPAVEQSGQTFWIEWFSTNSNGPIEMWIDNIRIVPEPSQLGGLALILFGFCVRRHRNAG
ncbi:MAG: PEP-CTERM sorting domain-containing protein [Planctomycetota bacterium]